MSQVQEALQPSQEFAKVFMGFERLNLDVAPLIQLPEQVEVLSGVEISRLLTEVDHLVDALDTYGHIPASTQADVTINLETALAELSMPYAVTRTAHKVETEWDEEQQRSRRTFQWLGRCAVGVAKSGYDFHVSEAATKRVDVEVAEAAHSQETLRTGTVQFFLSPRMSKEDAPAYVAKNEHLHDEDSVRASYLITDSSGQETYRVMESLLVRDVPLEAWVAMLQDENNVFGKSITVTDETSALAVMNTFSELELPEEAASEGPVTLLSAVVPYIDDDASRLSVQLQLEKFREDQDLYRQQAKASGTEWYNFELALASSLREGKASSEIIQFVANLESGWSDDIRRRVQDHATDEGYIITRELAAIIEKAKRNIIATKAAVKTGNEEVIEQMDMKTVEAIQGVAQAKDPFANEQSMLDLERSIAEQNVEISGGCAGGACGLENVSKGKEGDYIKRLGGEKGDKVLKDNERKCRCGAKSIVYVFNDKKVIKHCDACGATEKTQSQKSV